jgi:hypothetical protein
MKARFFALLFALAALLTFSMIRTCRGSVLTFDDISTDHLTTNGVHEGLLAVITNGYHGFNWVNFYFENAAYSVIGGGTNGDYYGMLSISNVALNGDGNLAEIDSPGTNFNFLSAYLTGAWNSNLNIEVQGFSGTTLLYDTTVVASATNATLFTFNYANIDRLTFNSFGGQNAGFPGGGGEEMAMDNFTFEFVPEPSSLLLTTAGVLTLCAFLKRKRA